MKLIEGVDKLLEDSGTIEKIRNRFILNQIFENLKSHTLLKAVTPHFMQECAFLKKEINDLLDHRRMPYFIKMDYNSNKLNVNFFKCRRTPTKTSSPKPTLFIEKLRISISEIEKSAELLILRKIIEFIDSHMLGRKYTNIQIFKTLKAINAVLDNMFLILSIESISPMLSSIKKVEITKSNTIRLTNLEDFQIRIIY